MKAKQLIKRCSLIVVAIAIIAFTNSSIKLIPKITLASITSSANIGNQYISYDAAENEITLTRSPLDMLSEPNRVFKIPTPNEAITLPTSIAPQRVAVVGDPIPLDIYRQLTLQKNIAEATGTSAFDDDKNGLLDDTYGWDWYDSGPDIYTASKEPNLYRDLVQTKHNYLIPVVISSDGNTNLISVTNGLRYAITNEPDIIVMPNPKMLSSKVVTIMIQEAKSRGTKLIFY